MALAAAVCMCCLSTTVYGADVAKIGVVEFQRILDTSSAGKVAKAEITAMGKKMEKELKEKGSELEEIRKRLEREALVMSKEMREEKQREIRIKINDLKALDKKYKQNLQVLNRKLSGRIQKQAMAIAEEIGKAGGYLLIIEKTVVLYAPNTIDITDQIIQKFNADYAAQRQEGGSADAQP